MACSRHLSDSLSVGGRDESRISPDSRYFSVYSLFAPIFALKYLARFNLLLFSFRYHSLLFALDISLISNQFHSGFSPHFSRQSVVALRSSEQEVRTPAPSSAILYIFRGPLGNHPSAVLTSHLASETWTLALFTATSISTS
jgi:hypothetical protein